jgi:phosphate-selective porin
MNPPLHLAQARTLALVLLPLLTNPVWAATPGPLEERLAALEKTVSALASENKTLREKLDAQPRPATAAGAEDQLRLGGLLQTHVETGDAPDSRYAGINDRILVRRARLNLRGSFGSAWSFRVESEFGAGTLGATTGYRAQLTDAFVDWTKYPCAHVRLGQFKTPFGWEQLMSDLQNPFVERSLANDRLTFGRQIGLGVSGSFADRRLDYSVGAFNGNGVNNSHNDNSAFLTAARVGARPWSGQVGDAKATWTVGAAALTSRDTGTFHGDRAGLAFDSQFTAGPAHLRAEWLQQKQSPATGAPLTADGWYLAALYDLHAAWQLAVRYETYDANTATRGNETDTFVFGFNHRLLGPSVVLSLNYFAGEARLGGGDDRLMARLQVVF